MPPCVDEEDYNPNEERYLGDVIHDAFAQSAHLNCGDVKMEFNSGTSSSFVQEIARVTSSSFQVLFSSFNFRRENLVLTVERKQQEWG